MSTQKGSAEQNQFAFLTTKQAAGLLGISASRLRALGDNRGIVLKMGNLRIWTAADVESLKGRITGYPKGKPRRRKPEREAKPPEG